MKQEVTGAWIPKSVKMAGQEVNAIPTGGFWNCPKATYSKQTHDLLKEMMKESKLTNFQQRHLEKTLRSGSTLPSEVAPTSSARPKQPRPVQKQGKVIKLSTYSGGLRTRDTMERQGAFEKPEYLPPQGPTRSAREKEKLANIMAYGEDNPNVYKKKVRERVEPREENETDRFEELQKEIEDRREFMKKMVKLGKAKDYQHMIDTEISQKIREMEVIDKKRTMELEKLIAEDEKRRVNEQGMSHTEVS
ncbi:UPF0193 protein EVG1 homolog [Gigantopelta aegis]|uniref:UPF0193 protein EVG1 homolog n=1 Tax=Gigantopelta aegis TaxID=1735272 RepID=UPI001B88B020|nr:UPF0193 protein EVG1 homolog [Gigantopelta aegis]